MARWWKCTNGAKKCRGFSCNRISLQPAGEKLQKTVDSSEIVCYSNHNSREICRFTRMGIEKDKPVGEIYKCHPGFPCDTCPKRRKPGIALLLPPESRFFPCFLALREVYFFSLIICRESDPQFIITGRQTAGLN